MDNGPLTLVIIGASGDLTVELVPSLYRLACKKRLPENLRVVGVARSPYSDDSFRHKMAGGCPPIHCQGGVGGDPGGLRRPTVYRPGRCRQVGRPEKPSGLAQPRGAGRARVLFYLAVAPNLYEPIVSNLSACRTEPRTGRLAAASSSRSPSAATWPRRDTLSRGACPASARIRSYRIDHYLGKETVQNILAFRFANTLFEPVWNHELHRPRADYRGREGRHGGARRLLRRVRRPPRHVPEPPAATADPRGDGAPPRYAADPLRNEKVKVLESIPVPSLEDARVNWCAASTRGYRSEKGVKPDSKTPTFAALRLEVDNWRWRGVPFYLRSGKRWPSGTARWCPVPLSAAPDVPAAAGATLQCNRLSLCIQPDEGIHLSFQSKVPDKDGMVMRPSELEFHYREAYADVAIPEAYERLLLDAMNGDAALFMRSDEIERAWAIIDPFVTACEATDAAPEEYAVGSHGPAGADQLLAKEGRTWLSLCHHARH